MIYQNNLIIYFDDIRFKKIKNQLSSILLHIKLNWIILMRNQKIRITKQHLIHIEKQDLRDD